MTTRPVNSHAEPLSEQPVPVPAATPPPPPPPPPQATTVKKTRGKKRMPAEELRVEVQNQIAQAEDVRQESVPKLVQNYLKAFARHASMLSMF